jgi:ribosomal protein S18 acetylase RimI-like enzyme
MNPARPLKALWLRLRLDGVGPTVHGLVDACSPKLWHIYKLTTPPAPAPRPAKCRIDSNRTHLAPLRTARTFASEYFRDDANRAKRCFFAVVEGRLAGIVWVLDARHPSRVIALGPADVELAFLFVEPEFRGAGIARALIQEACRALPEQGASGIYAIIEEHNAPSQKAFLASGFEHIAAVRRPLLFGSRYHAPRVMAKREH